MGLAISYFYTLTPSEFYFIQQGYYKKQERLLENDWIQTKVLSWMIYNSIPAKGKKMGFEKFANSFFKAKEELKPAPDYSKQDAAQKAKEIFKKIDLKKHREVEQ